MTYVQALNPDPVDVAWVERSETREPAPRAHNREALRTKIVQDAVRPLHGPKLREILAEINTNNDIIIKHVSPDTVPDVECSQYELIPFLEPPFCQ